MTGVCVGYISGPITETNFTNALVRLVVHDSRNGKHLHGGSDPILANQVGPGVIDIGRNFIVEAFLKTDADWLLFLDTDMVFPQNTIDRLLASAATADAKVISGLCFTYAMDAVYPTMYYERIGVDGHPIVGRAEEIPVDKVVEVHATGAACLMIHREVCEKMHEALGHTARPWFAMGVDERGYPIGEDWTFCTRARQIGYKIFVDTGLEIGHIKHTVVGGYEHRVFRKRRETMTEAEVKHVAANRQQPGVIPVKHNGGPKISPVTFGTPDPLNREQRRAAAKAGA